MKQVQHVNFYKLSVHSFLDGKELASVALILYPEM